MDKYRPVDREPAADDPPLLMRGTCDPWGKPRIAIRDGEDTMTVEDGRLTKRALVLAQDRAYEKEAMCGPTESTAKFFDELDKLGSGGRIISRGRTVGFLGQAGAYYSRLNRE